MIPKADNTTQVAPDTLVQRDEKGADKKREAAIRVALEALKDRMERARTLRPRPSEEHCFDCFYKGRDAAIRAILGEGDAGDAR